MTEKLGHYDDWEPTTIGELKKEVGDGWKKTKIKIFSSSAQEWGILSLYEHQGDLYLDIEKLDAKLPCPTCCDDQRCEGCWQET